MKFIIVSKNKNGFIATTAVIILSLGIMTFSLVVLSAAIQYSDTVYKRELRIQANLNARSCIETIKIMIKKDYFLHGNIYLSEFGCIGSIQKQINKNYIVRVSATYVSVKSRDILEIFIP